MKKEARLNSIIGGNFFTRITKTHSVSAIKDNLYRFLSYLNFDELRKIEIATAILELLSLEYSDVKVYFDGDTMLIVTPAKKEDTKKLRSLFKNIYIDGECEISNTIIELKLPKNVSKNDQVFLDIQGSLEIGLDYKIYLIKKEAELRELRLQQQSKLASLGEMIGNIAHQWRQPLNQISALKDGIVEDYRFNELSDERVDEFNKNIDKVLRYMSRTIDDFRNFFATSKEKIVFDVLEYIRESISIVSASLTNRNIELSVVHNQNCIVTEGFPNEFTQVIINLVNNSKDAIISNKIENGKINIEVEQLLDKVVIVFSDNAGGIPEEIIARIFEPYFTTKFASQGTGLGLYMSKNIIEANMHGHLSVRNIPGGAQFTIELNSKGILNG